MLEDATSIALAGFCALGAILVSIFQILCHLRNYTEPVFQRYIIRLIFMVPVYATGSWFSLRYRDAAIYFDTIRDCYESWIIYNFTSLLLAYVGGPGAVVVKAEGKVVHPSWTHLTCCLPSMQVDGFFLRRCKQGTLQFVLLKPVMAALTLILYAAGAYTDGEMSPRDGYFYISILYNVCYTFALYGLMLFWVGAAELLEPFNPLLKFVLVKTVVFLTFWQGIAISAINSMGRIHDPEDGKAIQNFMTCVEMLIAGAAMTFAFPHKQYQLGGSTAAFRLDAVAHAISVNDVMGDIIHVFAPTYSDYVLYSDGGPAENVKRTKFRGQGAGGASGITKKLAKSMVAGGVLGTAAGGGGGIGVGGGKEGRTRRPELSASKAERAMERNRGMAILLDSESDAMDSDEEAGDHLGTGTAVASDSDISSDGTASRASRVPSTFAGAGAPPSRGATPVQEGPGGQGPSPGRPGSATAGAAGGQRRRRPKLLSSSSSDGAVDERGGGRGAAGAEGDKESEGEGAAGTKARGRGRAAVAVPPAQQAAPQRQAAAAGEEQSGQQAVMPAAPAARSRAELPAPPQAAQRQKPAIPPPPAGPKTRVAAVAAAAAAEDEGAPQQITLPRPKSVAERLAAVKAAAAATAEAMAAPESPPAWAAAGWGEAADGGDAVGGGKNPSLSGWAK